MSEYNKQYYQKLKLEHPEKLEQYRINAYQKNRDRISVFNREYYEKMKIENPEKIKQWRDTAYQNYKNTNPEKLRQNGRESARRYYEKNKEKCIQRTREYILKKREEEGIQVRPVGRPRKVNPDSVKNTDSVENPIVEDI